MTAAKGRTHDVPLGDGRVLRIGVLRRSGADDELVLAIGTGQGREWRETPPEGLTLPAHALPALVDALRAVREGPGE